MSDRPFISHFSPQRTDPELLERIHVQEERRHLLEESVSAMRESVLTANKHHLLFIGPRGAGKTHLIRLIHHRLSQQTDLTEKFRFAWLNEDETATSFLKLLILIYRDVSQRYPQDFPAADLQSIYGQPADIARERLGESLLRHLRGRTLVVLMENLDSLFKHMPEGEQRIWRAFVQNHPVFATVGTAQSLFDGVADRSQPFFGFFDTRHLTPLNVEDAVQLLTNIARVNGDEDLANFLQTPTGHARVQAIHDLAGGNPRIYLIFSEFLTKELLDDLVRHFDEKADRELTSYYQERLRWLSPQQQEIVQLLCLHSYSLPVKAIAESLFSTHNSITGQLKILRSFGYVRFKQNGREVVYELAEPLMRLGLQLKETHNRGPLRLIVDLLKTWYTTEELMARREQHALGSPGRQCIEAALNVRDPEQAKQSNTQLRQWLEKIDLKTYSIDDLESLRSLAQKSEEADSWLHLAEALKAREDYEPSLDAFSHVLRLRATTEQIAWAYLSRGAILANLGHSDDAILDFTSVTTLSDIEPLQRAKAHLNRGMILASLGKTQEALRDFTLSLNHSNENQDITARALFQKGFLYTGLGQINEAIVNYSSLIALENPPVDGLAWALCKRAGLLSLAGRSEEAFRDVECVLSTKEAPKAAVAEALITRGAMYLDAGNAPAHLVDYAKVFTLPREPKILDVISWHDKLLPRIIVTSIFSHSIESSKWKQQVAVFLPSLAEFGLLTGLGESLVRHLDTVARSPLNEQASTAWSDVWNLECAKLKPEDQAKMEIPLRLLRTGITYLKTKDEGSLLVLPIEERKILRDALKLPPESAE